MISMKKAELYYSKPRKHRRKKASQGLKKSLRKFKRGLQRNATVPELKIKEFLKYLEIENSFQRIFTVGQKGYIVDFHLPLYQMVLEIDGSQHSEKDQEIKDNNRTEDLLKLSNIKIVQRFDNDAVLNMTVDDLATELVNVICPFINTLPAL